MAVAVLVQALEYLLHLLPVDTGVVHVVHLVNLHDELVELQLGDGARLVLVHAGKYFPPFFSHRGGIHHDV